MRNATCFLVAAACLSACSVAPQVAGDGDPGAAVLISGIVTDGLTRSGVGQVRVCLYPSTRDCATTNAEGAYELHAQPGARVVLAFTAATYVPELVPLQLDGLNLDASVLIARSEDAALFAKLAGAELDLEKAIITVRAIDENGAPLGGVHFAVSGGQAEGPFYQDGYTFDEQRNTTGGAGLALWVNAEAGTRVITARHATRSCAPASGAMPANDRAAVTMPIVAGFLSAAMVVCQ